MSSPVVVVNLNWDGLDLARPDLDLVFEITEGLDTLPAVRGDDHIVPFRTGRLAATRIADHRPVVAKGFIAGSGAAPEASYRAYVDTLKGKLDPTGTARTLVATLEDGTRRWITCVPRNLMGGEMIGGEFRPLSIEWDALDPFWYSAWGSLTLDSGLFLDSGDTLDSGGEVVIDGDGQIDIDTLGTADIEHVRVRFIGPSAWWGVAIGLDTPDGHIGFTNTRALAVGETLEVDNYARTVTVDGVSVRSTMLLNADNRHGEYIRLSPGPLTIQATGATQTRVTFDTAWL